MMPRSEKQHEVLKECGRREAACQSADWFMPNITVVRALARRGLVTVHYIGQRWWRITLTDQGRKWSK